MDYKLELTQIHNWLDVFVTFRPLLEHVYSKQVNKQKNIYWSMVICNNFVKVYKILCNIDGQTKWLMRPSRTTIMDNISHLKSSRIASMWVGGVNPYSQPDHKIPVFFTASLSDCSGLGNWDIRHWHGEDEQRRWPRCRPRGRKVVINTLADLDRGYLHSVDPCAHCCAAIWPHQLLLLCEDGKIHSFPNFPVE